MIRALSINKKLSSFESEKDNKSAIKLFNPCKIMGAIIEFVFNARKPKKHQEYKFERTSMDSCE